MTEQVQPMTREDERLVYRWHYENERLRSLLHLVRFTLVGTGGEPPEELDACQHNIRHAVAQIDKAFERDGRT